MKTNVVFLIIAIAISALLSYWVFSVAQGTESNYVIVAGSAISFLCTLIPTIAINYSDSRLATNLRIVAVVAFLASLVMQFTFAHTHITTNKYIIYSGLVLLIYFAIFYAIVRSERS